MEIIPAIDIKQGRCVRLVQGDFGQETVFSNDPVEMALQWQSSGASRVHVVDLDGSKDGFLGNLALVERIGSTLSIPVQTGGGIRTFESANNFLSIGIDRIVLGTAAIENIEMVIKLCEKWGAERIVVAVDADGDNVAIRGWLKKTSTKPIELVKKMSGIGITRFLYTDINRDGTLASPNFCGLESMVRTSGQRILASGGVSSLEDIRRLILTGVEGVIVGSALYKGLLKMEEALIVAKGETF